mgnify:CR=1 FL=1
MNILHAISSIDLSGGGPSKSVSDLASLQSMQELDVTILAKFSANPFIKESGHSRLSLRFVQGTSYKRSLGDTLAKRKFDLLHGHGIWQMPVHHMAQLARRTNIPYIITPRGMLEPWSLRVSKWKKRIALKLYQHEDLSRAACIHATAYMEAINIRKLGFINPIAVIPNGIDLSEFISAKVKEHRSKRTILFLSRVHPKKGIELLINAWDKIDGSVRENWQVDIAGNGEKSYNSLLNSIIKKKGLESEIHIVGPLFGAAKLQAYHQADLFVLPTYSENFGIVVAEALACGVPVITTTGTPWEELNTHKAGWWIDIGVNPLAQTLREAMQINDSERQTMGQKGRKLVEEKYSIESVAERMIELYKWILEGGEKPGFVMLNNKA